MYILRRSCAYEELMKLMEVFLIRPVFKARWVRTVTTSEEPFEFGEWESAVTRAVLLPAHLGNNDFIFPDPKCLE